MGHVTDFTLTHGLASSVDLPLQDLVQRLLRFIPFQQRYWTGAFFLSFFNPTRSASANFPH